MYKLLKVILALTSLGVGVMIALVYKVHKENKDFENFLNSY